MVETFVTVGRRWAMGLAFWPALVCGEAHAADRYEFVQPQMGTEFQIVLYTTDEAVAKRAAGRAFARVAALNAVLSDYDDESELMRLCAGAGGPPKPVSEDLWRVLTKAREVSERSEGAFDVTMGPVVRLWRRARRQRALPDAAALAVAREKVDYRLMELDPGRRTVRLARAGMRLDLGGIAKGYAADEALKVLRAEGISSALVAAGGDIALGDAPPGEAGWRIAIAAAGGGEDLPRLILKHANVSTSGDAEQFLEVEGVRYSHVVDPRTGLGVRGQSSVTVVARDGMTADSLATAVSVLGPDAGMNLVEETPGAAAIFVRVEGHKRELIVSGGWKDLPKEHVGQCENTYCSCWIRSYPYGRL